MNGYSKINGTAISYGGHAVKQENDHTSQSSRIAIISAGITGLAAAMALRRQGHDAEVRSLFQIFKESKS
jgi:NADPH-dependent glutamate synthase beta subunit-like oxidoreductase